MDRRRFLALTPLVVGSYAASFVENKEILDPEKQTPVSPRGRQIAEIARSIRIVRDLSFAKRPERELRLDVYSPNGEIKKPLPAIVTFGTAAWRTETKSIRPDLDNLPPSPTATLYPPVLVPQGFVVVSAECRVSGEARFPAQIHDCKCAVKWVRAHAGQYCVDPERIGVLGASSDGHLAALVAVTSPEDGLEDKSCYPSYPSRVQAAICFAGFFDFEFYQSVPGDGTLQAQINDFLGGTYDQVPGIYRQASPTHYVTADDPPFLLMHGLQDRRVPYEQTPHFAKILEKAGVPVRLISINNYVHGPIPGKEPDPSYKTLDLEIDQFFHQHLKENGSRRAPGSVLKRGTF